MTTVRERREAIRRAAADEGRLGVEALAKRLGVTSMTIRRDLAALEREGLLTRVHGGCIPQSPFVAELSFPEKLRLRQAAKSAIAREAVRLLRRGDSLYLDTGTTALQVARALPPDLDLRVFTNNLRVAMELFGRAGVAVTVFGGALGRRNPDLAGEVALDQIAQYRVDAAIVGGDALDPPRGEFYAADAASAALSRTAQRQAERVIVVMDSSKLGRRGLAAAGRLAPGMTLVCDEEADRVSRAALRRTGARLVLATIHLGDKSA
jgi:DeoR family fructose operon transcriptional repressor